MLTSDQATYSVAQPLKLKVSWQYLTDALDKLELCQRKLTKAGDDRDKAVQKSSALNVYVDGLQKVCTVTVAKCVFISMCVCFHLCVSVTMIRVASYVYFACVCVRACMCMRMCVCLCMR